MLNTHAEFQLPSRCPNLLQYLTVCVVVNRKNVELQDILICKFHNPKSRRSQVLLIIVKQTQMRVIYICEQDTATIITIYLFEWCH